MTLPSYQGFRGFLNLLESTGKLVKVQKEVDTRFDVAAGIRKVSDARGPALLYENIRGYAGWKIAAGLFASRELLALALGVAERDAVRKYETLEEIKIPPETVASGPVQEVVQRGAEVDLRCLPIVVHSEMDAGPYVTIGVQTAADPETGIGNLGIHRMLVLGRNRLTLWAPPDHHLGRMIARAEERGKGLPVATIIGADPRIVIASQVKAPFGCDEMEIAGGMTGAPVPVVPCRTIPLKVPAGAEIVIEGITVPGERMNDGPFAEYTGCYSEAKQAPVLEVTAITMRRDAIYHTCLTGFPPTENHVLVELANVSRIRQDVQRVAPEVHDVCVTAAGCYRHHVVVSIRKRHEEEARNIILALLASGIGVKYVIVVDDDIDVNNPLEVEWAMSTRMQPDRDVIIIPRLACSTLDPSIPSPRTTAGWGVDATKPLNNASRFAKVRVPGVEDIDYI